MEEKNKLPAIFGGGWCLAAAIAALMVYISEIAARFLQIVRQSGISYIGNANIFIQFIGMIFAVPMLLIGIGLLLMYIAGVKGQLHPAGITMVKVSVMIRGIAGFAGIVLAEAVVLICTILVLAKIRFVYILLLLLLANAVLIYYAIVIMMYTLRINKILGEVRSNHGGNLNVSKSVAYVSIILTVLSSLGLLFSVTMFFAGTVMSDVIYGLGISSDINGILASYTSASMMSWVFSVVRYIGMIILFIMSFMLNGRLKQFSGASLNFQDMDYDTINSITQNDAAGNDGETVLLNVDNVQIQPDIPDDSYENLTDTGIFEGEIISLSGTDKGITYPARNGEEIIIGKDPNVSNIVIDMKYGKISRKHCGIKYDAANGTYKVIDYSSNGTYINSVKQLSRGIYVNVPRGTIINLAKENLNYMLD